MEKRVIGVVLTLLGILGLIMAAYDFVNTQGGVRNIKMITVYGILGLVFFLSGIGLIRGTKDVMNNNEKIS